METFLALDRETLIRQALWWREIHGPREPLPVDTSALLNVILRASAEELRTATLQLENRRAHRAKRKKARV